MMLNGHAIEQRSPIIAIGVPSYDMMCAEMATSLAMLTGRLGWARIEFALCNARHSIAAAGRNVCVEQAQKAGADYLFFMDSDMVVPTTTVEVLLSRRKDIVGALYRRRGPPYDMMGIAKEGPQQVAGGLLEMLTIPTGCMLIDMRVFAALKRPYFHHRLRDGEEIEDGEDYVFCDEARDAGFSVWADIDLTHHVKHLGMRHLTAEPPLDATADYAVMPGGVREYSAA